MEGTLKVTPEELIAAAAEFRTEGGSITTLTTEMTNLVQGLSSVWEGEAAMTYINQFRGLEDDIQKLTKMVQEHADDLESMAEAYRSTEQSLMEENGSLSSDVIV